LPLQIEKKCFFIKMENRFSCLQKCFLGCSRRNTNEEYDHYIDVKEKFPRELERILNPQRNNGKGNSKKANQSNRILDESAITNMTVG